MMWTIRPRSEFGVLAAIRSGEGPPLVLLHGVGLRAEAWAAQIEAQAETWTVIAPDMPGHGESPVLSEPATLSTYTDLVAAAITRPVCIAGHSMGAMIALDLAIRHPDKVRAIAALNAIYRRTPKAAAAVQHRAASLDGVHVADPSGPLARWFDDEHSPEASACRSWLTDVSPDGYKAAYTVFAHENGPLNEELAALRCPALFATGAAEPNSTPAMSHAMAALVPDGRAIVLEGAAHMMPMTHPKAVISMLSLFFDECRS
ncbi:MAG: alpha/beta fold hydrolase [Geminicoccales bacterium]